MTKILMVSEHPFQTTGYAIIAKEEASYLGNFYEVYYFPILTIPCSGVQMNRYVLLGVQVESNLKDVYKHYLETIKPDLVIIEGDAFAFDWLWNWTVESGTKIILRVIMDGDALRPTEIEKFKQATALSCFSHKVMDMVKEYNPRCYWLPGFYTEEVFYPRQKEHQYFNFLYVGTNVWRKNVAGLVQAFSLVYKEMPDARLLLHCIPFSRHGYFLPDIIEHFGLKGKVEFTPNIKYVTYPTSALADLYASSDVFVSATFGEGFGLPHVEAMAMGLSQVYPDFGVLPEVVGDAGIAVPISGYVYDYFGVRKGVVDVKKFGEAMLSLYSDKQLRQSLSTRAVARAKKYEWKQVAPKWRECVEEVLK